MDDTDRRLIGLLRDNARLPVATLAKALGVSRGTVQNRIDRLVKAGVIQGFTVRTRPEAELSRVRAVMMIGVEGERSDKILQALKSHPEITSVHTTNGRWDMVIELNAENLEAFDRVLHRVRQINGVSASETSLLLSTYAF